MVTRVIVTHGRLGQELLQAAEVIVGELPDFRTVTLDWKDSFEEACRKTRTVLEALEAEGEVLILTDMYGGTPYNVATAMAESGRIEVVTGVNLPMVVRLGCPDTQNQAVGPLAKWIQAKGRKSICRAGETSGTEVSSGGNSTAGSCRG